MRWIFVEAAIIQLWIRLKNSTLHFVKKFLFDHKCLQFQLRWNPFPDGKWEKYLYYFSKFIIKHILTFNLLLRSRRSLLCIWIVQKENKFWQIKHFSFSIFHFLSRKTLAVLDRVMTGLDLMTAVGVNFGLFAAQVEGKFWWEVKRFSILRFREDEVGVMISEIPEKNKKK